MKKINLIIASLILGILLTSCQTTGTNTNDNTSVISTVVISCTNHQDKKLDFSYYPHDSIQWYSKEYDVNVYLIDTIDGEQIALNSLELQNYTCTQSN